MVNQEFRIDVVVDPGKSKAGVRSVGKNLDSLEKQATELRKALVDALTVRERGTIRSLDAINSTLERTEMAALVTDARISQLGKDVQAGGVRRVKDELEKTGDVMKRLKRLAKQLFAGIGIAFAIKGLASFADQAVNLQNRLRVVTESEEELISVTRRLFEISNATRQSFEGTVTIFQRLKINQEALGISTDRLFKFTTRLNQAIAISGLTSTEARNGIIQLSQGLASGALRGDELRSVLEQLPPLAILIAKEMGTTVGELRELGTTGAITTQIVIDALADANEVAAAFAQTIPTISQAFLVLSNNTLDTVGSFNEATGASEVFARSIIVVADNLDIVAIAGTTFGVVVLPTIITQMGILTSASFPAATAAVKGFIAAAGPLALVAVVLTSVSSILKAIVDDEREAAATRKQLEDDVLASANALGSQISQNQREINKLNRQIEAQARRGVEAADSQLARIAMLKGGIDATKIAIQEETQARKEATAAQQARSEAVQDTLAGLRQEAALLKLNSAEATVQRELLSITAALKKKKIDLDSEGLKTTREEIEELVRGNAALARQQALLDRIQTPGQKYKQLLDDLDAALMRGAISQDQLNAAAERFKPKEKTAQQDPFEKQVRSLREANELLEIRVNNEGILQSFLIEQTKLQQKGQELTLGQRIQLFGLVTAQQFFNAELKKQTDEEREIAKAKKAAARENERLDRRVERLKAEIDVIGQLKIAEQELRDLRGAAGVDQENLSRAIEANLLRQLDATMTVAAGIERAFIRLKAEAVDFAAVSEASFNVFADRGTEALLNFVQTGSFIFKEFVSSIIADLLRLTIRLLVVQGLTAAIGGGASLAGSLFGGGAPVPGRAHGGGVRANEPVQVGERGTELFIPPTAGTIVPSSQVAAATAPPEPPKIAIINQVDPDEVAAAMNSGEFDDVILNVVRRNPSKFKGVL